MNKAILLLLFGLLVLPFASAQFIDSFTQIRKVGEFSINSSSLNIMTANTTRLYITQSGMIGIGTVPTNYNLTVLGSVNITSDVIIGGTVNFTGRERNATFQGDVRILGTLYGGSPLKVGGGINVSGVPIGQDAFFVTNSSGEKIFKLSNEGVINSTSTSGNTSFDWNTLFIDITNDRVGIGTVSPSSALQVVGTITATQFIGDGSFLTGVGGASPWNSTALRTYLNDTNALVGIGTTTPVKKLTVNGTLDAITFDPSASTPTINTTGNNLTLSSSTGSVIIKLG